MKLVAVVAILTACGLAGCVERMTLEEAQKRCTQQGGLLVVIHSQKISRSGAVGPDEPSPGDCVSPNKFDLPQPAPDNTPAPAHRRPLP